MSDNTIENPDDSDKDPVEDTGEAGAKENGKPEMIDIDVMNETRENDRDNKTEGNPPKK